MSWTKLRSHAAVLARDRDPNDPELLAAKRDYRAERLAIHVAAVVALAPPLTPEQRERIASLLSGGGAGGDAA